MENLVKSAIRKLTEAGVIVKGQLPNGNLVILEESQCYREPVDPESPCVGLQRAVISPRNVQRYLDGC